MSAWDEGGGVPLLVKNTAAEILFGNVTAENVYKCYQDEKRGHDTRRHRPLSPGNCDENKNVGSLEVEHAPPRTNPNFYRIWLILVKALLQHDKNSPFCLEIKVDTDMDIENGRFELVSFAMPCYESSKS